MSPYEYLPCTPGQFYNTKVVNDLVAQNQPNTIISKQGNGALQAPPLAPLSRWTRPVLTLAVVSDTTQPI